MDKNLKAMYKIVDRSQVITDVREGGLILGDSHEDGGIPIWNYTEDEKEMFIAGEMQGLEFIMNSVATEVHKERLEEINSYNAESYCTELKSDSDCIVYTIESGDAVLSGRQFIINRSATLFYLSELCKLNETTEYPKLSK